MAHISADRVQETTTTTGTATITLTGAVTNFKTFSSRMATSDTCYYAIVDSTNNTWEVGVGTLASSTTLARTTVLRSSNSDAAVSFAAGTKNVFLTLSADNTAIFDADDTMSIIGITADPVPPVAGTLKFYSKNIAGKMVPKTMGPSGLDSPLQNAFWQNNIVMWNPTTATAGVWLGTAGSGAGTYSTQLPTTTNLYTSEKRGRWANVVTTTNQALGQRQTELMYYLGNTAGQGGFLFYARCGFDVWTNGGRFFAGMCGGAGVVTNDPSGSANSCGFAVDAADNGLIYFQTRNATTVTRVSTGFTIASNKGYDCYMFVATNSSSIGWRIDDSNAGTTASGTATATTPAVNTMMEAAVMASNAALTTATAINLGLNRIYVETDH